MITTGTEWSYPICTKKPNPSTKKTMAQNRSRLKFTRLPSGVFMFPHSNLQQEPHESI